MRRGEGVRTRVVLASELDVRETRRWLWERNSLAERWRLPQPRLARTIWRNDPAAAARSLRLLLTYMVTEKVCDPPSALAWAQASGLDGGRVSRTELAVQLNLTTSGVDGRLRRLDALLADAMTTRGVPIVSKRAEVDVSVAALIEYCKHMLRGDIDIADGYRSVSMTLEALTTHETRPFQGRDRSLRSRTKSQALKNLDMIYASRAAAAVGELIDLTLSVTHASVETDPVRSLDQLEQAWQRGEHHALPLLLSVAGSLIPDVSAAGVSVRQRFLEIGSNIFRDVESAAGIGWTTAWILDSLKHDPTPERALVSGLKTRAHLLQIHGYLRLAAADLSRAATFLKTLNPGYEDSDLIADDVLVRGASIDILRHETQLARASLTRLGESNTSERMRISTRRLRAHLVSTEAASHIQRLTPNRRQSSAYESAIEDLLDLLHTGPIQARMSTLDTLIASAMRVGDSSLIRVEVDRTLGADAGSSAGAPNVMTRLSRRLLDASGLPKMAELRDVVVSIEGHPLRAADLIPADIRYIL